MEEEIPVAEKKGQRQLVLFQVAGETYGLDIYQVREIIRVPEITRVPRTPPYLLGVINLRGGVIPVLDLRRRFHLPDRERHEDQRIIVTEQHGTIVGMIVDGVSEVLTLQESQIEPPSPYIVSVDTRFIAGIGNLEDRLIVLLDLEEVLSKEEAAGLAAAAAETETA
ncbi:MAG: chemotaxis protein CheW [Clostridiales bacterium]|nr:chemotaxis protein CheW [Clostridiales bacterium]